MVESGPERPREERVLAERARAMAVPLEAEDGASESLEVVTFTVGAERYGIEIGLVREVRLLDQGAFCRVPCVPAFVVGLVNIRGGIRCVIDVGAYLSLAPRPLTGSAHVVLVATSEEGTAGRREVGILSDAKPETVRVHVGRLRPPPDEVSAGARRFIRGVTEEMLILLDAGKLFEDPGMIVQEGE